MSDRHLDDEALSAVLDGEATADESAHADACAECGARLEALRQASLLVRTPVDPPTDEARDRAIAAALAAHNVVPLADRRRVPPAWLAAAAIAVVMVGAIALAGRGDRDREDADTAAGGGEDAAELAQDSATMMLGAPIDGGDLGEIDIESLEEIVQGALGGSGGGGTASAGRVSDADEALTTTAAPAPEEAAGDASVASTSAASCEESIRSQQPQLGALVYRASGTLDGEPVGVYAFDVVTDDGTVDRWVFVTTVEDCRIRNQQTFEA